MTAYRAGNGKFVSRSNPVAVAALTAQRAQSERERLEREAGQERLRTARRRGYRGPVTRAQLAASVR